MHRSWPKLSKHMLLITTICAITSVVSAQTASSFSPTVLSEQGKLIRAPEAVGALGVDLFGDKVNFYNGSLEFVQNDVSIPGNNSLPVSVGRRLVTGSRNEANRMFMEWDLEMPYVHGTFSAANGWTKLVGSQQTTARCTNFGVPADFSPNGGVDIFRGFEFWNGNSIYVPGVGDQEILKRYTSNNFIPNDGQATPLVTKGNWMIRCLPSLASNVGTTLANDMGEGFLAIAPDGTQYRFDWLVRRDMIALSKTSNTQGGYDPEMVSGMSLSTTTAGSKDTTSASPTVAQQHEWAKVLPAGVPPAGSDLKEHGHSKQNGSVSPMVGTAHATVPRVEVRIYPTQITDRFGNTVTYTYDTVNKSKLLSIQSSDGRVLTLTHVPDTNFIKTVSDGTRTWTYNYGTVASGRTMLTSVTLPDASSWQLGGLDGGVDYNGQYGFEGLVQMQIEYQPGPDSPPPTSCADQPEGLHSHNAVGTIVHPSGAIGTFAMQPTAHGRNGVPLGCYANGTPAGGAYYPAFIDSYSLTSKTITGPGLTGLTWTNDYYEADVPGWNTCGSACIQPAIVKSTDPAGHVTRYTFGATFGVDEGMLKQVDVDWNGSSALRSTSTLYNRSFVDPVGTSDQDRGDNWVRTHRLPEAQRIINQQSATFTWEVNNNPASGVNFDPQGRALKVTRSSSLGDSRTETTVYADTFYPSLKNKWIISQIYSVTDSSNKVMTLNTFDPTNGNLLSTSNFGKLINTYTYYADGTLKDVLDGKSQKTTYSSYKRGIARSILYADSSTESADVNDIGLVNSYTNQVGSTWTYDYDFMGRLKLINYPTPDTVAWNSTTLTFEQVQSNEADIEAGHWRQTVATGNARTINYFDALWRPVLKRTYDNANPNGTGNAVLRKFDFNGKPTYESYPQLNIASIYSGTEGTSTTYDALGRATEVRAASEIGDLVTTTNYGSGFQTAVTNPRNFTTYTTYQAFDEPSDKAPRHITAPEGVNADFVRDNFGKTTSITRSGAGKSATRSYVYDGNERLCKTIEPETGATVQDYDLANNVAWRASGNNLPSLTCDTASVPANKKIAFAYDTRNRLTTTTFSDGTLPITRTYKLDGLADTVSSNGAVWTNSYNKRRLNEHENLVYGGITYNIDRSYEANGNLQQLNYPDGTAIAYNPNALGQASQVGSYATSLSYHPNGAVAGFTYGNGIVHSLSQHKRGLPWVSNDAGVLSDVYAFDQNGNVNSIIDQQQSVTNRTMVYDGLDRLTSTSAPNLWGSATYGYDTLDNLTSSSITAGGTARTLVHNINAATNRIDSTAGTAAYAFNYAYDAQGNITQRGTKAYTFDQGNRMKSAVGTATYTYDGLGHRVSVVGTDGINRVQVYTQAGQMLFIGATGGNGTKYIYLDRHMLAEVGPTGTQYDHTDALGSPVARTDASRNVISRTRYEPFGLTAAGTVPTIGFTGHVNDADTGLIYMQQRYYDPVAGRFLSIDPVTTDANTGKAFNRYEYANSSPYKYVDPDGRIAAHAAAFAIGFAIDAGVQHWVEGKSWSNVNYKESAIAGVGAALTGAVSGKLAAQAMKGVISYTQAITATSAVGGAAGAAGSVAGNVVNGEKISVGKALVGFAGGAVGAGIGATVDNAATKFIGALSSTGGVMSHIADATRPSVNFGQSVRMGETAGQAAGKAGADTATAVSQKKAEQKAGL